jgi:hypothetical protein
MSSQGGIGLPDALERAAGQLPADADAIRPANGDPTRLLELLDAEAATRVLRWLLEHEPADGAELAEAWAETPESGGAPLLAIDPAGLPKAGAKALRRARHRLRSRGVAAPAPAPAATRATLPPVEAALDEAVISPLDPRGTRAAYLVMSNPGGGARLFELLLDESQGVLDLHVYTTARGKVRRFLKAFERDGRLTAVPAPAAAVRALVARVAAGQPSDRSLPRGFSEWRSQIAAVGEGARPPGELAREALDAEQGREAAAQRGEAERRRAPAEPGAAPLRRVAELVRAGEIGPWPPSPEVLKPLVEQLGELARGAIIVSGARRREQADRTLEQALPAIFTGRFGEDTARRFEETAYVLWQRGEEADARACLSAARAFRQPDAGENPVARALIEAVLAPVLAQLDRDLEADDERSRLVKP